MPALGETVTYDFVVTDGGGKPAAPDFLPEALVYENDDVVDMGVNPVVTQRLSSLRRALLRLSDHRS
jgi:hypothetical protein